MCRMFWGRQADGRNYPPPNKNTLIRALTEKWDKLPQKLLDNFVQRDIKKSHSLSSLLNFLRAFSDGPVAGVQVVKVSNHGWHVSSSSPVPQKTRRVGQRCTLNISRAEMSSRWCGVVVRRGVPAQVSPSSFDHFSKLRGPSLKALV
ncbi:uncharacterized protein TNCV_4177321 [Trichonephila clavipes]|nr:uncharacterized protein TNCV_4177321 [Trichonephila clavipes]